MADLSNREKAIAEKVLNMASGYVLEFSNNSFSDFIIDSIDIDPYDNKYDLPDRSSSKANRLRGIFKVESNYKVGKLLRDLVQYKKDNFFEKLSEADARSLDELDKIGAKLMSEKIVENIEAIVPPTSDKDAYRLVKSIKDSIDKNEPENALDRLHTYVFQLTRSLCDKHGIQYLKEESLNAVFGKYVNQITAKKFIETFMGERILRSSISNLDAFNKVRNDNSYAHPNLIVNYDEAVLIANNVVNTIKHIQIVENNYDAQLRAEKLKANAPAVDDLPF